jgi:hypothetical protein
MLLKELIILLAQIPRHIVVSPAFGRGDSYRGYYEVLAFQPLDSSTVGEMLDEAVWSLNRTYRGYKGGDFLMTGDTQCVVAVPGCCSMDDEDARRLGDVVHVLRRNVAPGSPLRIGDDLDVFLAHVAQARPPKGVASPPSLFSYEDRFEIGEVIAEPYQLEDTEGCFSAPVTVEGIGDGWAVVREQQQEGRPAPRPEFMLLPPGVVQRYRYDLAQRAFWEGSRKGAL